MILGRRAMVGSMLGLVACGSSRPRGAPPLPYSPRPLPAVTVDPLGDGEARPITDIVRGRVAVIDVWATWCEACKEVAKMLDLLVVAKDGTDLLVVGVDVGEDEPTVARYLQGRAPRYPIVLDTAFALPFALDRSNLPAVLVVDRTGTVRMIQERFDSYTLLLVEQLLAEPRP